LKLNDLIDSLRLPPSNERIPRDADSVQYDLKRSGRPGRLQMNVIKNPVDAEL